MSDVLKSALSDVRVLDLTEERGLYAGKMLADLGADVLLIEKPAGSPARRLGPFNKDIPGLENSLYFLNFNTNKRGITLDLEAPAGRDIFKRLAQSADVVIEDGQVGRMQSLGLNYPALKELNKGLIMASISGFGQNGPYSSFKAPDLVSFAMGGMMYINGPENAAPVVAPCQQTYYSASITAGFDILAALFLRLNTGRGQFIDVSTHQVESNFAAGNGGIMHYSANSQISRRRGSQFGVVPGRIYPCKDGHVHIIIIRPNHWIGLQEVMGNPEALSGEKWYNVTFRNNNVEFIDAHVIEFTLAHNKLDIAEWCQAKGVPCTPVNTMEDFYHDPHMQQRDFFLQNTHPVIGEHTFIRPPALLSETPCRIRRSAPLLGEHNREVFCATLGYSEGELEKLKEKGIV
jgi:crotonobetainyl-CoA:carnitine CoA-transferase CaiB-like acyl-CoA transferase